MAFYDKMQAVATKLLKKFGKVRHIQYESQTGGVKDNVFGGTTGGTPKTVPLIGVVTKVSESLVGSDMDGTTITSEDRLVIVDAKVRPAKPGRLIIGGEKWTILGLTDVDPAGTPIIYKVVCRGA